MRTNLLPAETNRTGINDMSDMKGGPRHTTRSSLAYHAKVRVFEAVDRVNQCRDTCNVAPIVHLDQFKSLSHVNEGESGTVRGDRKPILPRGNLSALHLNP